MSRISDQIRQVKTAEATLAAKRLALHESLVVFRAHGKRAATPGRVVGTGLALGVLTSLLTRRKKRVVPPEAAAAPAATVTVGPSVIDRVTQVLRLVSMTAPMLTALIQARTAVQASHPEGEVDPLAPDSADPAAP